MWLFISAFALGAVYSAGIVNSIPSPDGNIIGLAWQENNLWAVDNVSGFAYRINPETGDVLDSFYPDMSISYNPWGLACGNDTLFINYGKATAGGVPEMYDTDTAEHLGSVPFC